MKIEINNIEKQLNLIDKDLQHIIDKESDVLNSKKSKKCKISITQLFYISEIKKNLGRIKQIELDK
tara:strand:- start:223 stop:420 length:198 start_codon:yes stop_codon:yes gene_type:complete